jgi:hypothetical protein
MSLGPVAPPAPNRQPQLAAGSDMVYMVFGSGESIWFAKSRDGGRTFLQPSKVADLPKMLLGRHRGPRVVIGGGSIVVSAIPTGTDLFYWRSTDGGRSWSKGGVINDKPTSAREGLHAMAATADGHFAAAWLDDRIPGGKRLWGAFSNDGGATWSKNVMLYDGTICECCHPSLLALPSGDFEVMWRNKLDGSRDFYVLRLHDGKAVGAAVKQGEGTWKLDACPMDGGGVALRNGQLVTAWRREHDVYVSEAGKPETKIAAGMDPALAATAKGIFVAWTAGKAVEALTPSGRVQLSEEGGFPSLLALPDGSVLAAWESGGAIGTRRLE